MAGKKQSKPIKPRKDITGQQFGSLTALCQTGRFDKWGKPTWLLQCDCAPSRYAEMSISRLNLGYRLNCGDLCHSPGLHYPPTPKPYPKEAAEIVQRHLPFIQQRSDRVDSDIEDERMERLLRAAWILVYRRSQGEDLTDLYEKRYINKSTRNAGVDVRRKRWVMAGGICNYTYQRYKPKKEIGSTMANITSFTEAVSNARAGKTQLEACMPKKRFKFKRC